MAAVKLRAVHGPEPDDYRFDGHMIVDDRYNVAVAGNYPDFHITADDLRIFAQLLEVLKAAAR